MKIFCALSIVFLVSAMSGLTGADAMADPDERELYSKALSIAQGKVLRDRAAAANRPGALSTSSSALLFGRPYQKGDSWDLAVWRLNQTQEMLRPAPTLAASELRDPIVAESGLFRFKVIQVSQDAAPVIEIEVTQLRQAGFSLIDPAVERILISGDGNFHPLKKQYFIKNRPEPFSVSPNGIRKVKSLIDFLPIDFIPLDNAVREELRYPPRLPPAIREFAAKTGFKPDLSRSVWLEQDDFFGRPIQALWEHGDPWPSYIKTPHGIALLVRKGAL
ncbi:MAG TPA: hypothetical protein DCS07_02350 [Bdellovibrionales bacterium]|nr:MAG: hypothetical protein A2Z97_14080 [Bdellovibrionales bacterium GWB1_52_6]OFZ06488.1 MAG: hypothetical protein A2X97_16850 [Bdellovibrionales bacterium GWA1_52_35]OFZ33105.1 MAG: hypothetical protein A2070_10110 [Bdellovibrionales bacterium GWC1_52_8]HAR41466.1 hypothetical protein [Bdellovibrionales bacterium]HCM39492.1 hypothetical protein [Bdellovibrionales bacterium]